MMFTSLRSLDIITKPNQLTSVLPKDSELPIRLATCYHLSPRWNDKNTTRYNIWIEQTRSALSERRHCTGGNTKYPWVNRQGVSKRGEPRIIIPRPSRPRLISGHVFPPGVSHRGEPRHGFEYHSNELHPTLPLYMMLWYIIMYS